MMAGEEEDHGVVALSGRTYALSPWGQATDALSPAVRERVGEVPVIGDALAPRRLMDAPLDGARRGRRLYR